MLARAARLVWPRLEAMPALARAGWPSPAFAWLFFVIPTHSMIHENGLQVNQNHTGGGGDCRPGEKEWVFSLEMIDSLRLFGIIEPKGESVSIVLSQEQKKERREMKKKLLALMLAACLLLGCFGCQSEQDEIYSQAMASQSESSLLEPSSSTSSRETCEDVPDPGAG